MTRPIVLDLYCCAGGATRGYQNAGFDVIGIDNKPRLNYCGEFLQADVVESLTNFGSWGWAPDLIHASPPCQDKSTLTTGTNRSQGWGKTDHVQLVPATRRLLDIIEIPYVIEQPTGHGGLIRTDLRLCMDTWPVEPPRVWRHRDFELHGFTAIQPIHQPHLGRVRGWRHGEYYDGDYVAAYGNGGGKATVPEMQHALGIDWTDVREELTEAIPPAYTEYIGKEFLK